MKAMFKNLKPRYVPVLWSSRREKLVTVL